MEKIDPMKKTIKTLVIGAALLATPVAQYRLGLRGSAS
jgi:hypothetical protein